MNKKQYIKIKTKLVKNAKLIGPTIRDVKYNLNSNYKNEMFENIVSNKIPGFRYITKGILPKKIEELGTTKFIIFQSNKLVDELQWMSLLINKYKKEIDIYLKYKNAYEQNILIGNYREAKEILNKIEESICISLWGLSQKFLVTEQIGGIKKHKELLAELSEKSKSSIVVFILDFLSFKAEANNTYESLLYKIEKKFHNKKISFLSEILEAYLVFTLDVKYITSDKDKISKVLALQNTMSIIDIYETYIKAIHMVLDDNKMKLEVKEKVFGLIKKFDNEINDFRIHKSLEFLSNDRLNLEVTFYKIFSEVLDNYTKGNYIRTIDFIEKNKLLKLGDFNIYIIYVKSNLFSNNNIKYEKKTLLEEIVGLMYLIYNRVDLKKNIQELVNRASMLNEFKISKNIINFTMEFDKKGNTSFRLLSEFNSEYYTPRSLEVYSSSELIKQFEMNELFSITLNIFNNNLDDSNIACFRREFYKANSLIDKDINGAIQLFEELYFETSNVKDRKEIYYNAKINEELYYLYIKNTNYNKALDLIISAYFKNKDLIYNIDISILWNIIRFKEDSDIYRNVNTPILAYLVDNKDYDEQYKALANYIEANNKLLFWDLLNSDIVNDKNKQQIYFISEKIYVIEVIKRFVFIEKSNRINERINVIRYLIDSKCNFGSLLENELNVLVKEQSISEKIKTLDASKIVVDSKGILQKLDEVYKSKFQRFLDLKDLKVNVIYIDINDSSKSGDKDIQFILDNSKEKQQQSYLLFKELVEEYMNELLFNTNYGLDKFLSSRIRHGMLQDYLSKPFTNNNILNTKKNNDSKDYIFNQYVEKKIVNLDDELKMKIIDILARFSSKIMNKIKEVENWIRIKSDEDVEGLFDYSQIEAEMPKLYVKLMEIIDYNIFYKEITDVFWNVTEERLQIIRGKFDEELYNFFREALSELDENLRSLNNRYKCEILNDLQEKVGVCSSILRQDLKLVRNWFQIKKDNQYVDFLFQDLISTCIEINNKLNNEYSKISNDEIIDLNLLFRGDKFTYWIDIINILYVNAIKHSGFKRIEEMNINIKASLIEKTELSRWERSVLNKDKIKELEMSNNRFMMFSIENTLSSLKNEKEIEKKVESIFKNMENSSYSMFITTEGGTGIYKIANILTNNIKTKYMYGFSCSDKKFKVEIIIELNNEIVKEEYYECIIS